MSGKGLLGTVVTLMIMAGVLLSACAPAAPTAEPTEVPPTPVPPTAVPEEHVLVLAYPETPAELDIDLLGGLGVEELLANAYDAAWGYKITTSPEGVPMTDISKPGDEGIVGELFESWEVSEDGTVYTCHLRKGVKSYYGNEFTADDYLWRVERAYNTGFIGAFQYDVAGITGPQDVTKIDDYTIQFKLPGGPNPILFKSLATVYTAPADYTELKANWITDDDPWAVEAFRQHTFGFGPYHLESITPGEGAVLVANPNYWKGKPYWDEIIWREVPDAAVRFQLLQAGEVHYVFDALTFPQMEEIYESPKGKATLWGTTMGNEAQYFALNTSMEPFNKKELRQAMAYATPYEAIRTTAFREFGGSPSCSFVPEMYLHSTCEYWVYEEDLDKAKELWEAANGPKEFELVVDSARPAYEDVAILIKTNLAKIGIDVNIRKVPTSAFWEGLNAHTFQSVVQGALAFVSDGNYNLWICFHTGTALNYSAYSNPEVDRMLDEAMVMKTGDPRREQHAKEIQRILSEDIPGIPLLWRGFRVGISTDLDGMTWYYDYHLRWNELHWK